MVTSLAAIEGSKMLSAKDRKPSDKCYKNDGYYDSGFSSRDPIIVPLSSESLQAFKIKPM
jgi:hypothetical protein